METTAEEFIHNEIYSLKERILALISIILGFVLTETVIFSEKTVYLSAAVFSVLFLSLTLGYYRKDKKKMNAFAWIQGILIVLFSVNLIAGPALFIRNLNIMLLIVLSDFFVYSLSTGRKKLSIFCFLEITEALFKIPFSHIPDFFGTLASLLKNRKSKNFRMVFAGILMAVPVLFIVAPLLMSADENMAILFMNISDYFSGDITLIVIKFVSSMIVGCHIFSLIYGNSVHEISTEEEYKNTSLKFSAIHPVTLVSMTIPMCVLYIMFFFLQLNYFVCAFSGRLPSEFSYAEYARKGFFELCAVSVINLSVIIFINVFCKKEEKNTGIKICTVVLSVFTEILIATAVSKMVMYICNYGFTQMRLYTTWFMLFLAVGFVLIVIKQIFGKLNLQNSIAAAFMVFTVILFMSGADARIADWNIKLYQNSVTETLDFKLLDSLSDEAVPYIDRFALSGDSLSDKAVNILRKKASDRTNDTEFCISSVRADKILKKYN